LKRVNPSKALECLTRIKYRLTTEKIEVKEEIKQISISWVVSDDAVTKNVAQVPK